MRTQGSWSGNGKYVPSQTFHQTSSNTWKTEGTWSGNGKYVPGFTYKKY